MIAHCGQLTDRPSQSRVSRLVRMLGLFRRQPGLRHSRSRVKLYVVTSLKLHVLTSPCRCRSVWLLRPPGQGDDMDGQVGFP